jgi:hypothetical protein
MAIGPGKYDPLATQVQQSTHAEGVVLLVFNGKLGSGFSVQATAEIIANLPTILRNVAADIERSIPGA